MTLLLGFAAGIVLGLASFGGLWVTVHRAMEHRGAAAAILVSSLVRIALAGAVFFALTRIGAGAAVAGLCGLVLGRHALLRATGGIDHAR